MNNCKYWKEVWERKGNAGIDDLYWLGGYDPVKMDIKKIIEHISKNLQITKDDKVLEIGCGAGNLAQYLVKKCDYMGMDYSSPLIDKFHKIVGNNAIVGEADKVPFGDKYFDKTFLWSVLQYFPTGQYFLDAIKEMERVTKDIIFIGDIPMNSERKEHHVYTFNDIQECFPKSFCVIDMQECTRENRFNITVNLHDSNKRK